MPYVLPHTTKPGRPPTSGVPHSPPVVVRPPTAAPAAPLQFGPSNFLWGRGRHGFGSYDTDESRGFGNWLSDVAKAVIPSKTIVGKLLSGNTQGAIASTAQLVSGKPTGTAVAKPGAIPGASMFAPGGFISQNQTILLGGAAALAAILILKRRRA